LSIPHNSVNVLHKAATAYLILISIFLSKKHAMNPSSIDEINNSSRGVIASVTNNSRFVLLLDVHDDVGYASHGKARADKLAILPGEKFPRYFGGNSIGAGVEVCFRFGVWDCAKDFKNLPDRSVAAKRNWIHTRMRVDQFGISRIIKAVGGEKLKSQRVANLFVMFDVPKVGANWICVTGELWLM
jgi:hypothetical protein